jgi:dolichyl-diphosphooligosaccharide--protein glycosyltransferase
MEDGMTDESGPAALLEDRPELEGPLEAVLSVDATQDTWTFDDVDIDSGAFGELVSRGIVTSDGDEYRVADPAAVRAALDGEPVETATTTDRELSVSVPDIEPRAVGLLTAAIAAVVLARTFVLGSVYRGGTVVLSGNDPYYYRYWIEQIAAESGGAADFSSLEILPGAVQQGEPLMVATLWWLSELLGGTVQSIGHVLAWYPVVSAVLSAILVYVLAVRVTKDQRVGLASVLFLAIIPGHALRTSLGFADHHAFDYPWLGLTALGLLVIVTTARDEDSLRTTLPWVGSALLGLGVTGQVLSWEAGPLLILPVGIAVLAKTLLDVEAGRSPLLTNAPVVIGTGLAAVLVWTIHSAWGWHTTLVASTPALLFAGVGGVVATAEVMARLERTTRELAIVDGAGALLALAVVRLALSDLWNAAAEGAGRLSSSDGIVETFGLFDPRTLGFLLLFGFAFVLAVPAMAWGVRQATQDRADWPVVSVYAWYFTLLAGIQTRFVGELATFTALFAGYAFVWLASKVEVSRPLSPASQESIRAVVPERQTLGLLFVLFLLVGSFGIVQTGVKTTQATTEAGTFQTAMAINESATTQSQQYPDTYVLSRWGNNRMYNYFVSGEAESYGYARANYERFIGGTNGEEWYDRLQNRVGYVVIIDGVPSEPEMIQTRLNQHYGSQNGEIPGLGHYRAVYATEDESTKAFELVPGGTIEGTASPGATVTATTTVTLSNTEFEYSRRTQANRNGAYRLLVANEGRYTVESDSTATTVTVTESDVRNGTTVSAS